MTTDKEGGKLIIGGCKFYLVLKNIGKKLVML